MCVNALSALASAFTILFLYWTITALGRKLLKPNTTAKGIALLGAAAVGALAYTFSDTFWFSAVEGEVYALSSLFTAIVFWLILKWDEKADEEGSDKWLILIMYLMGLSIGVHLQQVFYSACQRA
jgi:4-amino-4-deoxy-L-arabinose transferase-like glycosyltransferase